MRTFFFIGALAAFADLATNAISIDQVPSVPDIAMNLSEIDAEVPTVADADAEVDKKAAGAKVCAAAKKTSKECDEAAAEKERERKKKEREERERAE